MLTRREIGRNCRHLVAALACVGAVLAGNPAGAVAGADEVLLPDCGNVGFGGQVAPVAWSSGCLGGSVNLDQLIWQSWGGAEAVATGVDRYNTCEPSCAGGEIFDFPVELRVDQVEHCASSLGARWFYTRFAIVVEFPPENEVSQPPGRTDPFIFTADCAKPGFLVKTRSGGATLGPFVEEGEYDGARLDGYFGPPSRRTHDGPYICIKHWGSLGLTVKLGALDSDDDPCDAGRFLLAILLNRRWHTPSGVSHDDPARKAAAASVRGCTLRLCRSNGYVLSQHRSECGFGRFPSVVADTGSGRVRRLLVYSHFCE